MYRVSSSGKNGNNWSAMSSANFDVDASRQNAWRGIAVMPQSNTTDNTITVPRANPKKLPRPRSTAVRPVFFTMASMVRVSNDASSLTPKNNDTKATIKRIEVPDMTCGNIPASESEYVHPTKNAAIHPIKENTSRTSPRNVPIMTEQVITNITR